MLRHVNIYYINITYFSTSKVISWSYIRAQLRELGFQAWQNDHKVHYEFVVLKSF